jgi:potassium efflux system protein
LEQAAVESDGWDALQLRAGQLLLAQQRDLLESQLQSHKQLERLLVDGNQLQLELLEAIDEYGDVLTGNLLWLRSYDFLMPERLLQQLSRLAAIDLTSLSTEGLNDFIRNAWVISSLLLLVVTILTRPSAALALETLLTQPLRPSDESVGLALKALGLTLVMVLPLPLLLGLLSNALERMSGDQTALIAIADGLQKFAGLLLIINLMDRLSARQGVGRRLMKWSSLKIDALRADLRWAKPVLLLASALTPFGLALSPIYSGGAIAALGSALAGIAFFAFALRALRSGQFHYDRLGRLILQGTTLVSGAVILMHLTGQLFAAHMYLRALGMSLTGLLVILPTFSLIQRHLLIYRSRLQRRARSDLRDQGDDTDNTARSDNELTEQDLEVVASLDDSYERLLGVSRVIAIGLMLWWIWSPALPAFEIFNDITLWTTVDDSLPDGQLRAVTLSTLLLSLLIGFVTVLLTRHLPPMANVLMLEWGNASSGSRYATTMLMQYVIIGVGASLALAQLGFAWSKLQWLVAALGVGIGFGLQEIVANFISGIILLFERPIRVGDVVNAGGHDGTVTRINPRATVIETFEGKEVLVPNKDLITGVVTNWSLSSTRLRVVVPVGIAYGSDVETAMKLLLQAAAANTKVLDDPAPWVTFEDFGDNALVLWLRCYTLENFILVATELRVAIYEAFNNADITIAFPQRDIHLDASSAIPVRMVDSD